MDSAIPFCGHIRMFRRLGLCQLVFSLQASQLSERGVWAVLDQLKASIWPEAEWQNLFLCGQEYYLQLEPELGISGGHDDPAIEPIVIKARLDSAQPRGQHLELQFSFLLPSFALAELLRKLQSHKKSPLPAKVATMRDRPKALKRF